MNQKEFSLMECYVLAGYGLKAEINNGKLEGFAHDSEGQEKKKGIMIRMKDKLVRCAEASAIRNLGCGF